VNRFRSGKANELETYLEENGYIEPRDTLDQGQIRARIIERFVDEGVSPEEAKDRTENLLSRMNKTDFSLSSTRVLCCNWLGDSVSMKERIHEITPTSMAI